MYKSFDVGAMPLDEMLGREWLATNGVGGYASSTIPGLNTRKYHGLLVAAMAPPVRRMVLLSRVEETVHCDGWPHALSTNEYPGTIHPEGYHSIRAFSPDPFPRWAFQGENWTLQKELCLLQGRNIVCLTYTLLAGNRPLTLELRPLFALRPIHELSSQWNGRLFVETPDKGRHRIPATTRTPEVFFAHTGAWETQPNWYLNTVYRREQERGYSALEDVWSPGAVRFEMSAGQSAHFACSADPFDFETAVEQAHLQGATTARVISTPTSKQSAQRPAPQASQDDVLDDLVHAAGQFIVSGGLASEPAEDAKPEVIGHYLWSPPSGRAALAGFTGLFLITGKTKQARSLLLSMASQLDRGLVPSEFPEIGTAPLYLGADVSLWFVNAVYAYLRYTGDDATVTAHLLEPVLQVVTEYRRGTRLGISADETGLIKTHAPARPTTWMDAKVGDWVVTPRQGRPVEVNALWYNAVCIAADLAARFGRGAVADELWEFARTVRAAFNERFWNPSASCCVDVVSDRGVDPAIRPNQLLAMSLPFAVLAPERHAAVLERVSSELRTPLGVRTLSPKDPGYCGRCGGDVVSRDRAAHAGSAFPWLLGPLVTSYLRVYGRDGAARHEALQILQGCIEYFRRDGMGQLPELFDGDAPHHAGGAIASALSVAEVLRAYYEDVLDRAPSGPAFTGAAPAVSPAGIVRPLPSV